MSRAVALPVIIEKVWDEDFEKLVWQVRCPHCRAVDAFRKVERAIAWNITEEFSVVDGRIMSVVWHRTNGSGTFEHWCYECQECEEPVLMTIEKAEYVN